jgi:hypothetical protein
MKTDRFKLRLRPTRDGVFTQLRLCGLVPTALPPCELSRLLRQLSSWTGAPVEIALPADVHTAEWFELWTYALSELPAHLLQVRFTLKRRRQRRGNDAR